MPGVLHALFGLGLGLFFWKFSGKDDGKKRWSFGLVLIFALNNYFGPDLRGFLKRIAAPLKSDILYIFAGSIHTFLWWPLFAIFYAGLWFVVLSSIEKARAQQIQERLTSETIEYSKYSYADVYIAVLTGGFCHLFIDLIGHPGETDGEYYVNGSIPLFTFIKSEIIIGFVFLLILSLVIIVLYGVMILKLDAKELLIKIKDGLSSKNAIKVYCFLGVALLNVLIIYTLIASTGNFVIESKTLSWNDNGYSDLFYDLGTMFYATKDYDAGSATWYLAIWLAGFFIIAIIGYAKDIRISIQGKEIRLELLAAVSFFIAIISGYLLQPLIGNISGGENDFGVLIFIWSTLGITLVGALIINPKMVEL